MRQNRWILAPAYEEQYSALATALGIHPILAKILVQRGVRDYESARAFFRPQLTDLYDPFLMKGMDSAVNRILRAFRQNEKILVFGDYDVDGTTAVAMVYQFLRSHTSPDQVGYYIPHRYREGYGLSTTGVDYACTHGYKLIVTLDCGIKSPEEIRYAKGLGIDSIICDHHMPGPILPDAIAILNPKQPGCNYPFKELCGCGVGFKLISALLQAHGQSANEAHSFLDLVATATAADIVPMTDENRILTWYGLRKANENPSTGIRALSTLTRLKTPVNIQDLVFLIGPRINAAGRMDDARKAVELFVTPDPEEALDLATLLHSDNGARREVDARITAEALNLLGANPEMKGRKSTVVYQPHWHKGVIGIVASRLIDYYYRPTIVFTQSGEIASGSGRSIPGFNIHDGLEQCRDLLLGFGGHCYAAGMTILPEKIPAFTDRFEEVVARSLTDHQMIPELNIDSALSFKEMTPSFYRILCQMEPFGPGNMRPLFLSSSVQVLPGTRIVKDHHVRFELAQEGVRVEGIGFNLALSYEKLKNASLIDIVYSIDENEWNGRKNLQLKVVDIRKSS